MPITLTKAYNPGDNAPGESYTQVQITNVHINLQASIVMFNYEVGNVVKAADGTSKWVKGSGTQQKSVHVTGEEFKALGAVVSQANETVYAAVKRSLYQYLITQKLVTGTIA